jgi:serine protease AprX
LAIKEKRKNKYFVTKKLFGFFFVTLSMFKPNKTMLRICLLFALIIIVHCVVQAQTPRLIEFADKNNSPFSLQRPQEFLSTKAINRRTKQKINLTTRDLPVNPAYLAALRQAGATVLYPLRWFNACVVTCNDASFNAIRQLAFVKSAKQLATTIKTQDEPALLQFEAHKAPTNQASSSRTEQEYGNSLRQAAMIGLNDMHAAGYTGKGMTIAVFDSGFPNVDINKATTYPLMNILGTHNFVYQTSNVYGFDAAGHGTNVLSILAAYRPQQLIGSAYEASYYLFITEDVRGQLDDPIEETNWAAAAERADSLGVDIINSSLGYNYFNNPAFTYNQTALDGKTSLISKAATLCASVGMLVVSSAGNLFEREWTKIKMPADADSILTVGSVDTNNNWVTSSLQGNTTDGRVKPDVAALGSGVVYAAPFGVTTGAGTSYAAPLITGLAAGLWQANPNKTNMEIIYSIRRSASIFQSPNTQIGYGIPSYKKAMTIVSAAEDNLEQQGISIFPNPTTDKFYLQFDPQYLNTTCQLSLIDFTGKIVWHSQLLVMQSKAPIILPKNSLVNGIYLLQINTKQGKITKKLLIQD